jgi:hypothetical protein
LTTPNYNFGIPNFQGLNRAFPVRGGTGKVSGALRHTMGDYRIHEDGLAKAHASIDMLD